MTEPEYYNKNGLSPLTAFKNGLLSYGEYKGFLKGNIIKYTIRYDSKGGMDDLKKLMDYVLELVELEAEDSEDLTLNDLLVHLMNL